MEFEVVREHLARGGAITALVTPFNNDGTIDYEGFRSNVQFQLNNGINGLLPLGTTGETPTLHNDEKERLVRICAEEAAGRVPVIVGAGTNSTDKTIAHVREVTEWGADALLIVNPYYNKPTQEGLYLHFSAVAESTELPIIVYNIQGRTGVNCETSTMERLAVIPNIIAVKEASGNLDQMREVLDRTDLIVYSGDDGLTLDLLRAGGHGVISVASNLIPDRMVALARAGLSGNWQEAEDINSFLDPLFDVEFIETNPIPIKAAMNMRGLAAGSYRLPMCDLQPENRETLHAVLERMRII